MADFKSTKDFRKGMISRGINEDPTYLSFLIMFDYYTENSPLFNGQARNYLQNVIGDETRVKYLDDFTKILKMLNQDMPWYWQSISGLDVAKTYGNMEDPFRGSESSTITIGCLENVELTLTGMMDLYRKAAFDLERYVEVLPKNLRRFSMYIYISEVRVFSSLDRNNLSTSDIRVSKPFFKINLGRCEFNMDSGISIFSDLNKNPEASASSIVIKYETTQDADASYANSILVGDVQNSAALDLATAANDNVPDLKRSSIEFVRRAAERTAEGVIEQQINNIRGQILLGNVYGLNTISDIQDAINSGTLNAISNVFR